MAAKKSKEYPYLWPNGTYHSVPASQAPAASGYKPGPAKGIPAQPTLPPPPPGTYDPALDYEAGAANRGLSYQQNDAATQFETGTEDYNAAKGNLATTHARTLADLLTQENDVRRQYTILGHQQTGAARQHGITSAGLLALSAQKRSENQAHDLAPLTLAEGRENEDFATNNRGLDANYARIFGGYNGTVLNDPYTGKPMVGSLATSLGRAGIENTNYQTGLTGQRVFQAQQGGYVSPQLLPVSSSAARTAAAKFRKRQAVV